MLDELDVNDGEQSFRQQTLMEDETGALNSNRAMVNLSPSKRGKNSNALTKS